MEGVRVELREREFYYSLYQCVLLFFPAQKPIFKLIGPSIVLVLYLTKCDFGAVKVTSCVVLLSANGDEERRGGDVWFPAWD